MKIKLSKSQWEFMGKKAGWMKTALFPSPGIGSPNEGKDIGQVYESLSENGSPNEGKNVGQEAKRKQISYVELYNKIKEEDASANIEIGDKINIISGPFYGFDGIVKKIQENQYIVGITLFGHPCDCKLTRNEFFKYSDKLESLKDIDRRDREFQHRYYSPSGQ